MIDTPIYDTLCIELFGEELEPEDIKWLDNLRYDTCCSWNWFDRALCSEPCGRMHSVCTASGRPVKTDDCFWQQSCDGCEVPVGESNVTEPQYYTDGCGPECDCGVNEPKL